MFGTVTAIVKWVSVPALLTASPFSLCAGRYEPLVDFVICLGAMLFVQRAVQLRAYMWAAAFVAIAVVFSPLLLAVKVFLLMGLTGAGMVTTLLAVFRPRPLPVE